MSNFARIILAVSTLAVFLTACSKGAQGISQADLQGTWTTDCINDETGTYTKTVVFKDNQFTLFHKNFAVGSTCTGAGTTDDAVDGTYLLSGQDLDWITATEHLYDMVFMSSDKKSLKFNASASVNPEKRGIDAAGPLYKKQN